MNQEDQIYRELLEKYVSANRDIRALTEVAYSEHYRLHLDEPLRFCEHETCRLVALLLSA